MDLWIPRWKISGSGKKEQKYFEQGINFKA